MPASWARYVGWYPDHKGALSSSIPIAVCESRAITHPERCHVPPTFIRRSKLMLTRQPRSAPSGKQGWVSADATDFKRFPFNNFTYCLTLFPKCFSSFPHGTCSLSVSRQYLALDGIYHPFWAAFPNNSTLRERITKASVVRVKDGILTLYDAPFQKTCTRSDADKRFSRLQLGRPQDRQILNLSFSRFTRSY